MIKQQWSRLRLTLRPSNLWSNMRYAWFSGKDRSNAIFASIMLGLFLSLGIFIYRTVDNHFVAREINCLAMNIYHEARGEPDKGKYAVASVTLNRVTSKHYPDKVCKVVFQKRWDYLRNRYVSAFSWTELGETPIAIESPSWKKASRIATEVYHNHEQYPLNGALFYHARHIRPSWARKKLSVARIGRHIFYN